MNTENRTDPVSDRHNVPGGRGCFVSSVAGYLKRRRERRGATLERLEQEKQELRAMLERVGAA